VTTLELSELGFEGPANEMAANEMPLEDRRAALPEILAFRLSRMQALGHSQRKVDPAEAIVIDARDRFRRGR
jgi:hypothetical protein